MNFVPFAFSPVTNESICFFVVSLVDCVTTLSLFVSFRVDKMMSQYIFQFVSLTMQSPTF